MGIKGIWHRSADQKKFDSEYDRIFKKPKDELAGKGTTYEEASNVNDEMKLHQEKLEKK